jgi:ribosome-associated toxin RatA of RatAB toxin-antitoxin module
MYRNSLSLILTFSSLMVSLGSEPCASATSDSSPKAQRFSVKTQYSSIQAGAARIDVAADPQLVTEIIRDYGNYAKLSDKFDKSRVIGRYGDNTDVYLQVPILKGAAKIWAVVRFEPVRCTNGEQVVAGHLVKGNVQRLDATWKVKSAGTRQSRVELELLIVPRIPVPGSLVTSETAYAADKAVTGVRNRAEKK